jgi:hypothetical protein
MATIHLVGSIACFISAGMLFLITYLALALQSLMLNPLITPLPIILAGMGCGLIALGWYIRVLSKTRKKENLK